MNKRLKQIYKEAKHCAADHHASNRIKCLKMKLKNEIGEDRDLLLKYKISCSKNSRIDLVALVLSTVALVLSLLPIILEMGELNLEPVMLQIEQLGINTLKLIPLKEKSGVVTEIFNLIDQLFLMAFIIVVVGYVIYSMITTERNSEILMVLEQIEKEMQ